MELIDYMLGTTVMDNVESFVDKLVESGNVRLSTHDDVYEAAGSYLVGEWSKLCSDSDMSVLEAGSHLYSKHFKEAGFVSDKQVRAYLVHPYKLRHITPTAIKTACGVYRMSWKYSSAAIKLLAITCNSYLRSYNADLKIRLGRRDLSKIRTPKDLAGILGVSQQRAVSIAQRNLREFYKWIEKDAKEMSWAVRFLWCDIVYMDIYNCRKLGDAYSVLAYGGTTDLRSIELLACNLDIQISTLKGILGRAYSEMFGVPELPISADAIFINLKPSYQRALRRVGCETDEDVRKVISSEHGHVAGIGEKGWETIRELYRCS